MHHATRARFSGGDPLALTKRIEARRAKALALPPPEPLAPWVRRLRAGLTPAKSFINGSWTPPDEGAPA